MSRQQRLVDDLALADQGHLGKLTGRKHGDAQGPGQDRRQRPHIRDHTALARSSGSFPEVFEIARHCEEIGNGNALSVPTTPGASTGTTQTCRIDASRSEPAAFIYIVTLDPVKCIHAKPIALACLAPIAPLVVTGCSSATQPIQYR